MINDSDKYRLFILANLYAFDLYFNALVKDYMPGKITNMDIICFNSKCDRVLDYYKEIKVVPKNIKEICIERDEYEPNEFKIMMIYEVARPYDISGTFGLPLINYDMVVSDVSMSILQVTNIINDISIFEIICAYLIVSISVDMIPETNINFTGDEFNKLKFVSIYIINANILNKLNKYFNSTKVIQNLFAEYKDDKLCVHIKVNHSSINMYDRIDILKV